MTDKDGVTRMIDANARLAKLKYHMQRKDEEVEENVEDNSQHNVILEKLSVEDCFDFALKESPRRACYFDEEGIAAKVDDDPFDKKSKMLSVTDDICTISTYGRVIDRIMTEIIKRKFDPNDEEQDAVLANLLKTFPTELCTKLNIKNFFDELIEEIECDDNKFSGVNNHPICINQHVPRPIRILLLTSANWKKLNFNRRKATIRHLLSELPHEDIIGLYKFLDVGQKPRMDSDDVS